MARTEEPHETSRLVDNKLYNICAHLVNHSTKPTPKDFIGSRCSKNLLASRKILHKIFGKSMIAKVPERVQIRSLHLVHKKIPLHSMKKSHVYPNKKFH